MKERYFGACDKGILGGAVLAPECNKKIFLSVNMSNRLKEKLTGLAAQKGKSRSRMCREILQDWINSQESKCDNTG